MQPKAVFYILTAATQKARDLYACRVIEKGYLANHKIYIYNSSLEAAQNFDKQLWTFHDISFLPHEIYNQNQATAAPILLGINTAPPSGWNDILVNLAMEIPTFYQQFNHIITIVPNDNQIKAALRAHYQVYQNNGYHMETFNIETST